MKVEFNLKESDVQKLMKAQFTAQRTKRDVSTSVASDKALFGGEVSVVVTFKAPKDRVLVITKDIVKLGANALKGDHVIAGVKIDLEKQKIIGVHPANLAALIIDKRFDMVLVEAGVPITEHLVTHLVPVCPIEEE